MDDVLISTLVDHVLVKGRKLDNAFKSKELKPLITQVHEKCDVVIAEKNANPNVSKLRGKVCPYFPELEILFGSDAATGDRAISGQDIPQISDSNVNDDLSLDENEVEEDENLPNPSVTSKSTTKGGGSTSRRKRAHLSEEAIAFSAIAESSKKIAEAFKIYANQKKIEWQSVVEKLKGVGISNTDVMKVMELFEKDTDLAHVFLGITDETFRHDWVVNKLRRIPSDVHH